MATTHGRKKDKKHGHSSNKLMDDYFMEGEKKSRELDHAPSARSTPPPPPPKAGGPLKAGGPPQVDPAVEEKKAGNDSDVD